MIAKMPLRWSDNRLATPAQEMTTTYRFEACSTGMICRLVDYEYRAKDANRLAALLVKEELPDGTVQFSEKNPYHTDVHLSESLHGMAALWRCQRSRLKIPRDRLKAFFSKSARGLQPEVTEWWTDTLNPLSRPWRVRRYSYPANGYGIPFRRRAKKVIEECLDFASDQDMIMFKLRWL